MNNENWEVIIIGGGSGGLSAALTLVRARRRVLVIDSSSPRNRVSGHMHAVLGHDGKPPLQLLAEGREEIARYGGVVRSGAVVATTAVKGGFSVECSDGETFTARALIIATGLEDQLPEIEGLGEVWGSGVAVCPYCDGYEVGDGRIGILATGPGSTFQAQLLRQWSPQIVYLENDVGIPTAEAGPGLAARGIEVISGAVARVLSSNGQLTGVELASGEHIPLDAIFTAPRFAPRDEPLRQISADRTDFPWGSFATVDAAGRTSVPGVWAVGNVVDANASVSVTIGAGALAGGMLNHELILEDIQVAVTAMAEVNK
ncbi:NAD(P)/FAD-dependent oxidoreductase [Arthrobacter sp. lap29]|uniref:NAD(P)/FAD-dependent oxidoreductase n=1 Tax=Arthrobacter sp. lap29 TaxID=3056122 RepID=UPI0028F6D15B|nr:NAD(P)/FAD-dependent oxidoreductase [Arthrobacter sp. lap29]